MIPKFKSPAERDAWVASESVRRSFGVVILKIVGGGELRIVKV